MDDLDKFLKGLDKFQENTENLQPYFNANLPRYLSIARSTADQILSSLRPPEADPDEWQRKVTRFSRFILADALSTSQGFQIEYKNEEEDEPDQQTLTDEITWDDVLDWVEAGKNNEIGGKDIQRFEAGRDSPHITNVVWKSLTNPELGISSKDPARLRAAIQRFLKSNTNLSFEPFLEIVLETWTTTFSEILERDLSDALDEYLLDI